MAEQARRLQRRAAGRRLRIHRPCRELRQRGGIPRDGARGGRGGGGLSRGPPVCRRGSPLLVDWEMALPGLGRMTSAELLEVVDGVIVRGELIYDAEALRRVMAQSSA